MSGPLMVLVAGPYRSGTDGDPDRIQANVDAMTRTALELWRRGHLPVMGEWFALPLIETAIAIGADPDVMDHEIFHPIAERLLARCDGCLRIGGASEGADRMVATARALGKAVWFDIDDVPRPSFAATVAISTERRTAVQDGWRVPAWLDHEVNEAGVEVVRDIVVRCGRPIAPGSDGDVTVIPMNPATWRPLTAGEVIDLVEPPTRVVASLRPREAWRP